MVYKSKVAFFMATTQTFETIVSLNAQQAKNEMATLKKALDDLKQKKAEALKDPGTSVKDINKFDKQIKAAEASLKSYSNSVAKTIDTVNNISTASLGDIEKAAREVRRAMKQVTNPDDYNALNVILQHCKDRMDFLKDSTVQSLKEMQELNHATVNLQRVLDDINGASLNDLTAAASTLQKELNDMSPNTDAFDKASESLQKINTRIQQIHSSQKEANLSIDKYDKEIAAARRSATELARENKLIDATLKNISGSSMRELQYSLKIVNERLEDTKQGTDAFDELNNKAKQLKMQITAINNEQTTSVGLWKGVVNGLNKNWGAITQTLSAFTGLSATVRQCVDAFTDMDQEMNNVRKYTGQSMEEVEEMNESFKNVDTRTARGELNKLAQDAGRLGITNREMIEEFVDVGDKIKVALGDDLGDGAIGKVGKLAMAFGEDDRLGLRGAMLATGSAINELAQNSSASAGYLVEFTARVAGVGKQVGLTQAQIMGYAAVMDENMQKDEMASTAFSQLLTKMSTDTKTFAKMAGVDLKTFSDLVKNDMNKAVITLMDNLKSKGGFDQLGKMFGDMGLDGARAVAVLTTMADKVDDIRERQEIATEAYREAKSVIEEFDVQNSTLQADVDKAKNRFRELTIELGEKLLPVVKYTISAGGLLVKSLSTITSFTTKYWKVLVVVTSGIVAYTLAVKAAEIAEMAHNAVKLKGLAIDKMKRMYSSLIVSAQTAYGIAVKACTRQISFATAAQKMWNEVILANPWAAAIVTMVAVTAALIAFTSKADKATIAQRELNKANAEAATQCRSEIAELSTLVDLVRDKAASDDARTEALRKLQEKYPGYLDNLTLENINSDKAREAVDNLTDSILAQAKARVYLSKIEELERKKQDIDEEYLESFWGRLKQFWRADFQVAANQIAHFSEKMYKSIDYGVTHAINYGDLKGFKDGWTDQTYIERKGYTMNTAVKMNRNRADDIAELQEKQNEWLKRYQDVQKKETEDLLKIRKANEQSDKLASLGTLSAGIAHEIQNPLNFVINFSQMANDMVDDLKDILDEKEIDLESEENGELAETIQTLRSYLAKIAEHGHRATDIIQGILLYSRGKSDVFMQTDIQALLKKYVWLSFHAMRANLANFNVTIHEEYDPSPLVANLIPQDISRAIINLMNNACYAVWRREKEPNGDDYVPTISIKSHKEGEEVCISIEDNGTGMSSEVKQKLFEAFFTTKPAGEGTGLGLSITREIIEKRHHGRIEFESEEGQFTRFTIHIPIK